MELLKSRPLMTKNELLGYVNSASGFILVVSEGIKPVLFSNGRPVSANFELPEVIRNVSIYSLDKLEALDFLHGDLKLPNDTQPGDAQSETRPQDTLSEAPRIVQLDINLEVPPEFALPIENGVIEAVKHLFQKKSVALSVVHGKGRVRQGFTGTNLLVLRVTVEGYSLGEVGPEVIADSFKEHIERELGFKTTVSISELSIQRVKKLPLVRFQRRKVNFRGGRVLEVPLSAARGSVKVDMDKLQKEVEKILQEAGLSEELLELTKKEEKSESTGLLERSLVSKLSGLRGITLNWIKVTGSGGNYSLALGINRTSKSLSDVQIVEAVREAIKGAESEAHAAGVSGRFVSAYVVIEKDIY